MEKTKQQGPPRSSFLTKYHSGDKVKKTQMAGHVARMGLSRGAHRVEWGNLREEHHLEDPGVDKRIILNGS